MLFCKELPVLLSFPFRRNGKIKQHAASWMHARAACVATGSSTKLSWLCSSVSARSWLSRNDAIWNCSARVSCDYGIANPFVDVRRIRSQQPYWPTITIAEPVVAECACLVYQMLHMLARRSFGKLHLGYSLLMSLEMNGQQQRLDN